MKQLSYEETYYEHLKKYHLEDIPRQYLSFCSYKRGEYLFLEGENISSLYVVISGRAKIIFSLPNGKTLLVAFYTNAGIIGDIEFTLGNIPACHSVQVLTDFTCIRIHLPQAQDYLMECNLFMQAVTLGLATKLRQSNQNDALLILSTLEDRLCSYIYMTSENSFFYEKLTETSELLATSYRHLLRTLEHLCDIQVLEHVSSGYHILDMNYLKEHGGTCYHIDKEGYLC